MWRGSPARLRLPALYQPARVRQAERIQPLARPLEPAAFGSRTSAELVAAREIEVELWSPDGVIMQFLKNWKTTLSGVATVAAIGLAAAHDKSILTNPSILASLATALGLIFAADSTATPPTAQ